MNRLQRMTMVNSAKVPYREVELDGHIHFIGTQGTGKSTVLRALLFFYNADSRKLGISKEKKSFADYYFPHADSYIFYEVLAGTRLFCVWLYKRQNRLCFRFMDGAYQRDIVLDGNAARSEADLMAKASELGIKVERAIYNFTDYRDIIYGENRSMRRYALLQGVSNYSTLPRTISNIFLNANLDGSYIKKTIIDSLSDEAVEINLDANRHHLDTARSHYADVTTFVQYEAHAEQIVTTYSTVQKLEAEQQDLAWNIGSAFNRAREQKRGLEEKIGEAGESEKEQQEKLLAIKESCKQETRRLSDQLAVAKKQVTQANERKRHYVALDIETKLAAAANKPQLEQDQKHLTEQRSLLTAKAEQQESQFEIAKQKLDNERERYIQQLRETLSNFKDQQREELDEAREQLEEQLSELKKGFEETEQPLQKELLESQNCWRNLELELRRLDHAPLFEKEHDKLKKSKQELEHNKVRTEAESKGNKKAISELEREAEDKHAIEQNAGENRLRPLEEERSELHQKLNELQNELEQLSGSLLEFLDEKVEGWHETIGKTVRRDLLLRSGLEPRLVEGNSLFGVALKLSHVESDEISKATIEEAITETEAALKTVGEQIEKQLDENRAAEDKLIKRYNRKMRELRDTETSLSTSLFTIERDIEKQSIAIEELNEKTETERSSLQADVEEKMHEEEHRIKELEKLICDASEMYDASKERVSKNFVQVERKHKKSLKEQESSHNEAVKEQQTRYEEQLNELNEERSAALKRVGVDEQKVAELDNQIEEVEEQLEAIREDETLCIEYAKDKREWIDRLPEFQTTSAQLKQKLTHQTELFERRIRNEEQALKTIQDALQKLKQQRQTMQQEIEAFQAFEHDELFEDFSAYIRHHDQGSTPDCRRQINALQNAALKFQKQFKNLTEQVTAFSGRFNEDNCIGLPIHLTNEASFRSFAQDLTAFIREQRLITLKTEVTKKYSMVLNTIVSETNRLLQREGEVQRVIQKINGDFRASNFVGVVHSIEMRVLDSSNRIFQVLREICQFQADNLMSFGEIDLFNRGDSGKDEKAVELLDQLRDQISQTRNTTLRLEDALDLEFRVCENENDTNWVNRLANVGSNGTDVLVKSMIYINLLNIFKANRRKQEQSTQLHCLVDEVGILHDSNVKSLIQFAAERGICMVNGSPNSHNEQDYKHIYMFRKEDGITAVTKLISHVAK